MALLIETANAYGRGLLKGVVAYVREHEPWSVYLPEQGWGDKPSFDLKKYKVDGIIARIETPLIARVLKGIRVPIVDVSSSRLIPSLPWFENDYQAIAKLAFDHFLCRGFKRFAFCSDKRYKWAELLSAQFTSCVRSSGFPCYIHVPMKPKPFGSDEEINDIIAWVKKLPKPIAIMGCNDFRARQVLEACRREDISVPDEVAVLGEDNDEVFCDLSEPPLSSIVQNSKRIGYEAAACLSRLMKGEIASSQGVFIPPIEIVTRQSSDVLAIEDRTVVQAVRFIREHACEGINVKDVLKAVPHSRRLLESRFKKLLGRTPHEEILHIQISRIKQLLVESELSMERIAEKSGFAYVEYMSVAFKRVIGMPPSEYRRLYHP